MHPHDFIRAFIAPLESLGVEYVVTGSIAAIFYGEPRLTHDIDLVISLSPDDVSPFTNTFDLENYYCPPEDIIHIELKRTHQAHFNLIHHETGLKADCYIFTGDPLHSWALKHRRRVTFDSNVEFSLAPIEYVIIRKLEYFDEGGSEKHLTDIAAMIRSSGDLIHREFLSTQLEKRHLSHYLPDF